MARRSATLMSEDCHLQPVASALSTEQHALRGPRTRFALLFFPALFLGAADSCLAQDTARSANPSVPEVIIQAGRQVDERVTQKVQETLLNDPMVYAEHVTVTTENGVVRLEGIVQDTGELFRILDLARKTAGARRVVDAMEILHNDPDGG